MPPPVPPLRLNLPPRLGEGTSRARHEDLRGDATGTSRDRNVIGNDGSWETSSADTAAPSSEFAPVLDDPERSEHGEAVPPRDDSLRASRGDPGGSETASEGSDAVPPDAGLLRAMRRPRLAASSVAAFLRQRDDLRTPAWETEPAAETSGERVDEASEAEGSGDVPPDAERTSRGSPRTRREEEKKRGALPAALLEEGPSSDSARGRERRRGRGSGSGSGSRPRGASWSALASSRDALLGTKRASRVADRWSALAAAADASAPDETDFVASAAVGNARRTEAAAELMTPTLGDAFVEEEEEERPATRLDSRENSREEPPEPPKEETANAPETNAFSATDLSRRLVVAEVASHYARKKADCLRRVGFVPARVRHPRETWNGGAPGLCRLAAPAEPAFSVAGGDAEAAAARRVPRSRATECFLSRTYTEGFGAPVAFAAYPSADVLCRACGDVAWDPVRFPKREEEAPGALPADASNLWCRNCLLFDGVAGERDAEALPVDETVAARVALKRVLCRHALACERVASEDASTNPSEPEPAEIRWRMDHVSHGCPDSGRLCDREQTERDCSRAVRVCGLPGDANPGDACAARVRAGDFETHAASCAFRLVPCSRRGLGCAHAVRFKHAEQHFRLCEHRPFACPNRPRCAWRGTRRDVEAHLKKECAWEIAECGLADDDPDGALARSSESKRAYDAATSADGRAYTFGGDALDFSDVSDFSDSVPLVRDARGEQNRKSLRSGRGAGPGRLAASRSGLGARATQRSSGSLSLSSASRRARAERKLERCDRSERCEVRLARCKMAAHRAVCRFRRATCRHCGAPRATRRLAQHEAECAFSRFACSRCGAEGIPTDARRTHDERVCPEVEMQCAFARYGCSRPKVPRREYAEHAKASLREHLALLTRRDANAPLPERTGDGDPYPALDTNANEGDEKPADGFMALVTRHEVTRGDARRVAAVAAAAADGVAADTAAAAAALRDAADAAASARELFTSQVARFKAQFQGRCAEALETFAEGEKTVETRATACLSASGSARRVAAATLADADALDAVARRVARETSALVSAASDASRTLGGSLVSLLAAAAPALDVRAETEARVAEAGAAAHARVARLEWTSADEAIVAWEKIGDARESFAKRLVPRDIEHRALLLKVEALERGRYVGAAEDQAMRRRARETLGDAISSEASLGGPAPPAPATPRGAGAETAEARS